MEKVLVFGGVSYNTMVELERPINLNQSSLSATDYHETVGSTGAGKALALNRLGVNLTLHGVIGDDRYGKIIKNYFTDEGINFIFDIDPEGTERHLNLMTNQNTKRTSIFLHTPPSDIKLDEARIEEMIKNSDIILLNIAPYCKRFIPLIEKYETEIWCDLHSYDGQDDYYDPFINCADKLIFSSEKVDDYKRIMKDWIEEGKELVACTHGAAGSTLLSAKGEWIEQSSLDYEVVDTNGAGDNFTAGLFYAYLHNLSWREGVKLGTITAGLAVTSKELIAEELTIDKLKEEYNKHYE